MRFFYTLRCTMRIDLPISSVKKSRSSTFRLVQSEQLFLKVKSSPARNTVLLIRATNPLQVPRSPITVQLPKEFRDRESRPIRSSNDRKHPATCRSSLELSVSTRRRTSSLFPAHQVTRFFSTGSRDPYRQTSARDNDDNENLPVLRTRGPTIARDARALAARELTATPGRMRGQAVRGSGWPSRGSSKGVLSGVTEKERGREEEREIIVV